MVNDNSFLYKDIITNNEIILYLTSWLQSGILDKKFPGLEKDTIIVKEMTQNIIKKLTQNEILNSNEAHHLSETVRNLIKLNFAPHTSSSNTKGLEAFRENLIKTYHL